MNKKTNRIEAKILENLYRLRLLSIDQLMQLIYCDKNEKPKGNQYVQRVLAEMVSKRLLVKIPNNYATIDSVTNYYLLTTKGLSLAKNILDEPQNIYKNGKIFLKRNAGKKEISVSTKKYAHQYFLNQFAISAKIMLDKNHREYKYYDEAHIFGLNHVRPDGMIVTADYMIFLEQDMGTETIRVINAKWERYRLQIKNMLKTERKIIIMMLCKTGKHVNRRISNIKRNMQARLADKIGDEIDVYIDTMDNMLITLQDIVTKTENADDDIVKIIEHVDGLNIIAKDKILSPAIRNKYDYFIEYDNQKIFCVLDFKNPSTADIHKIEEHNKYIDIPLLVVGKSDKEIIDNCIAFELTEINNVYYTTPARLNRNNFLKEIYKVFHFALTETTALYCYHGTLTDN